MVKLNGYENTYYEDRWEHRGFTVCEFRSWKVQYLIFNREHEMLKNCGSLEEAERFIDNLE